MKAKKKITLNNMQADIGIEEDETIYHSSSL